MLTSRNSLAGDVRIEWNDSKVMGAQNNNVKETIWIHKEHH
jgi:hypothetical protein